MLLRTQLAAVLLLAGISSSAAEEGGQRLRSNYPPVAPASSWDDLHTGVKTKEQWNSRRSELRGRFLELLRDQHKPAKPSLDLQVHETVTVDGRYERRLISYQVEQGERAHAYLGVPVGLTQQAPGVVVLHGTYPQGIEQLAGLAGDPSKAFFDHPCRRGFIALAPEHFVSGRRTPPEGPYDTTRFHQKHPQWTAVGKFTYEHSIAVDVLASHEHVDPSRIGVIGHSLGGHGAIFLSAYDERIKAAACNCGAAFFRHNAKADAWARDHWYVYFKHIRPALMAGELPPIDFHEIMALSAPRAMLDVSGLNDGDGATQRQRLLMLASVMRVYEILEAPDKFAFYVHGHGHSAPADARQLMYSWLDLQLKAPAPSGARAAGR